MFFLTLGRMNELVDYVKDWLRNKVWGYLTHKLIKMAKRKKKIMKDF